MSRHSERTRGDSDLQAEFRTLTEPKYHQARESNFAIEFEI